MQKRVGFGGRGPCGGEVHACKEGSGVTWVGSRVTYHICIVLQSILINRRGKPEVECALFFVSASSFSRVLSFASGTYFVCAFCVSWRGLCLVVWSVVECGKYAAGGSC